VNDGSLRTHRIDTNIAVRVIEVGPALVF
jgi:hypothetical protein